MHFLRNLAWPDLSTSFIVGRWRHPKLVGVKPLRAAWVRDMADK